MVQEASAVAGIYLPEIERQFSLTPDSTEVVTTFPQRTETREYDGIGRLVGLTTTEPNVGFDFEYVGHRYAGRFGGSDQFSEVRTLGAFGELEQLDFWGIELDADGEPVDGAYGNEYCFEKWLPEACALPLFSTIFVRDSGGRITNRNMTYGFPNQSNRLGSDWEEASFVYTNEGWLDAFVSTVQLTNSGEYYDDDLYYNRMPQLGSVTEIFDVDNDLIFNVDRKPDGRADDFGFGGGSSWYVDYDSEGRIDELGPFDFEYDQWSSLTTAHDLTDDYAESYIYDFQGRLVGVIDQDGNLDIFLYDGGDPVERWSAGPSTGDRAEPQDTYIWRPGSQQMLAAVTAESGGDVIFPVTDERQSVVGVWNDTELVHGRNDSD